MAMNVKNTSTSEGLDKTLSVQTTAPEDVDGAGIKTETFWVNENWSTYNSYCKSHIAVKAVMTKLGMWSVGKGYKGSEDILKKIVGWGKDTFNSVMSNQVRVRHANGDSYAEIITPPGEEIKEDGSNLINLKPLNPGSIGHIINPQGMLEGYKQKLSDGTEKPFRLNQVFHLSLNRTADEIHGTGDVECLITFLDKIKQIDEDMAVMFHRFVVPLIVWKLNTDDPAAISSFKTYEKSAINSGNNLIIPEKAVEWSLLEAGKGVGKIINPMEWRNKWVEEVIKGGGVPALIMAIEAGTTEASSKMVYLAWQQVIEDEQRTLEDQIKAQLGLDVKFTFPATIQENLGEDENKDGQIDKKQNTDPAKHE